MHRAGFSTDRFSVSVASVLAEGPFDLHGDIE